MVYPFVQLQFVLYIICRLQKSLDEQALKDNVLRYVCAVHQRHQFTVQCLCPSFCNCMVAGMRLISAYPNDILVVSTVSCIIYTTLYVYDT